MIKTYDLTKNRHQRKMFDPVTLGISAGIAGISALSGMRTNQANLRAQRETNALQKQMFNEQMNYNLMAESRARNYALEDFDRENAYNAPAAVRARYEAAGLNPALMMQGQGAAVGQMEATSGSSAPNAAQLGVPQHVDYVTPAMRQLVDSMVGMSTAQKTSEEAAGIASDTRVKAATEQLRIKQAFQENQKRIYELRSMKHLPKIKQMELKNLEQQNLILQDTTAMLDMTVDARKKQQTTMNNYYDALARKADSEFRAQEIRNEFIRFHEENKMRLDAKTIESITKGIDEASSRIYVNRQQAAKLILEKNNIDPKTEQGRRLQRQIESQIWSNYKLKENGFEIPASGAYERHGGNHWSNLP